jgi:hypothetical protein
VEAWEEKARACSRVGKPVQLAKVPKEENGIG